MSPPRRIQPRESVEKSPEPKKASTSASSLEDIATTAIGRADPVVTTPVQTGPEPIRHVVEPGETAYSIARLYGVSVTSLASRVGVPEPPKPVVITPESMPWE